MCLVAEQVVVLTLALLKAESMCEGIDFGKFNTTK